ncbi:MAG: hypothetical protein K2F59_03705 [Eubacteriales bacterium]|nr:hypothetical protein [Eubacteriales bacterium]
MENIVTNEILFEMEGNRRLDDILNHIDIITKKYPNAKIHVKVKGV